ncbi:GGDEF domain-containing protein [Fusobacteria bacterium ZRK30]|nr:GGDEF domain-containing protein [Fusobacteria bacterium ZRK30]
MINLKMNIMKFDLNHFILPVFYAVLFGSIITYLSQKRIRCLEEKIKEKTNELKHCASMDDTTITYNRRMGLEMLKNYLNLSKRHENNLAVCLIDLNGLKPVIDKFGYIKGNELMRDISEMLRSSIRESDIISRMDKDEFLTILPECDIAGARQVMRRLLEKIRIYNKNSFQNYNTSISFGISESSYCNKKSVEHLLAEAENKTHVIKKRRREVSYEKRDFSNKKEDNVLIFKLWVIIL